MYDIVMAVDENEERAAEQVDCLTEMPLDRDDVQVTILHVFIENPEGASVSQVGSVRHSATALEEAGFTVEMHGRTGTPAEEILAEIEGRESCLVSVGGRKRSAAGKVIFGSTSQSVLRATDMPVVVSGTPK